MAFLTPSVVRGVALPSVGKPMFSDVANPYEPPQTEPDRIERARRPLGFRVFIGLIHAVAGLVTAFLAVFHMCGKGNPLFERPFLAAVPTACFLLVVLLPRYWMALIATIVLLYVSFRIGQYYLYVLHQG